MKHFLLLLVLLLQTASSWAAAAELPIMPWPAKLTPQTGSLAITASFAISLSGEGVTDPRIQAAVSRTYLRLSRQTGIPLTASGATPVLSIIIESKDHKAPQQLGDDERYSLNVTPAQARLSADTPLGALRGIETFLQLIQPDQTGFSVPGVAIQDEPRFAWRGLSLDVARHFMPPDEVLRTIDGLAAVKLNVLHLHLSDDQGFRVESKKYPRLQQRGSDGQFYTQAEIRYMIAYARDRGVRIVPEFDMPGHATSWLTGYPMLAARSGKFELFRKFTGYADILDPTKSSTYRFLDGFIGEMAKLFPDDYFHVGGDEVGFKEWTTNPRIRSFMRKHKLANAHQLHVYFNDQVLKIVTKYHKHMLGWDEVLQPDLPKPVVIQSWRGADALWQAIREGHGALLSRGYYLDQMRSAGTHYAVDPMKDAPADVTPDQLKLLYGGEAAMWDEVTTAENLDSRLWPRLAAIAERFWSPATLTDPVSLYGRLRPVNEWLQWLGLTQRSSLELMRQRLAADAPVHELNSFAETVEPAKGYARHYPLYSPDSAFNHLIDSIPPESEAARRFASAVDEYLAGPHTAERSAGLQAQLDEWSHSAAAVRPLFEANSLLNADLPFVDQVEALCRSGEDALSHLQNNQRMQRTEYKPEPKQELMIGIAAAVQKLVDAAAAQ